MSYLFRFKWRHVTREADGGWTRTTEIGAGWPIVVCLVVLVIAIAAIRD